MLTAAELIKAVSLDPTQFNTDVVPPEFNEAQQRAALRQYVQLNVLEKSNGMVAVPFMEATGKTSIASFVNGRMTGLSESERQERIKLGEEAWKACQTWAGGVLLNDAVDSNSPEYDKDAKKYWDRLAKTLEALLSWARGVVALDSDTGTPGRAGRSATASPSTANPPNCAGMLVVNGPSCCEAEVCW